MSKRRNFVLNIVPITFDDGFTKDITSPEAILYNNNMADRIIWLDYEVDDSCTDIAKWIIRWNIEDSGKPVEERKKIKIVIATNGGDLDVTTAIRDAIMLSETPVVTINISKAYSAGFYIYIAADERYCFPNSTFLIHQGAGQFGGSFREIVSQIENYQDQIGKLGDYIVERTGITPQMYIDKAEDEWFVTANESVDLGISTGVIGSLGDILWN